MEYIEVLVSSSIRTELKLFYLHCRLGVFYDVLVEVREFSAEIYKPLRGQGVTVSHRFIFFISDRFLS